MATIKQNLDGEDVYVTIDDGAVWHYEGTGWEVVDAPEAAPEDAVSGWREAPPEPEAEVSEEDAEPTEDQQEAEG